MKARFPKFVRELFCFKHMRLSLLLLSLLFSTQVCFGATSLPKNGEVTDSVIFIEPFPGSNPGSGPRIPAFIPISASFDASLSTLFLTFTSNLGEIEVEVMNTTTGGYDSDTVDTQFLYAAVPITMGPGHYLILFTLPSGQRYKGELDI